MRVDGDSLEPERSNDPPKDTTGLEGGAAGWASHAHRATTRDAGQLVGPYKLVRLLGHGGMGEVWLATREHPHRRVALKLIRADRVDRETRSRFESERQALALLSHPNIARILETGLTDDGLPYFAMDFIEGEPLVRYCDKHELSIEERLSLFAKVCDAVHYAHQHGLIHRDLSPDNILVTTDSSTEAQPRIIDFGIAKAIGGGLALGDAAVVTGARLMIGKPDYMSPEQAEGLGVDTRTDVFALGAILYELLTGAVPLNATAFAQHVLARAVAAISNTPRPEPLTRFRDLEAATRQAASRARGMIDERTLERRLGGRLRHLPMKALRLDRSKRYSSAAAFALDIRNYLAEKDFVEAAAESWPDRARRTVRRHQGAFALTGVTLAALVAGLISTSIMYSRALQAEHAVSASNEVLRKNLAESRDFANGLLRGLYPLIGELAGATPAIDFLTSTTLAHLNSLRAQSAGDRSLLRDVAHGYAEVGNVQRVKGSPAAALAAHRAAMEIREQLAAAGDPESDVDLASSYYRVGELHWFQGDQASALQRLEASVAIYRKVTSSAAATPEVRRSLAGALNRLATVHKERGLLAEAESAVREAIAILQALETPSNTIAQRREYSVARATLADLLSPQGKLDEATAELLQAIASMERIAADDPNNARAKRDLVLTHWKVYEIRTRQGDFTAGESECVAALNAARAMADADPSSATAQLDLASSMMRLGEAKLLRGDTELALEQLSSAINLLRALAEKDPSNAVVRQNLTGSYWRRGELEMQRSNLELALADQQAAVALQRSAVALNPSSGMDRFYLAISLGAVGRVQSLRKSWPEARNAHREAIEILDEQLRRSPTDAVAERFRAASLIELGTILRGEKDYDGSLEVLTVATQCLAEALEGSPTDAEFAKNLALAHLEMGQSLEAKADIDGALREYRTCDSMADALGARGVLATGDATKLAEVKVWIARLEAQRSAPVR